MPPLPPRLQLAPAAPLTHLLGAAALCALFAWLTPTHQPPWASFHAELAMACAAVLAGAHVLLAVRKMPVLFSPLACLTLLAAVVPWAQLASGILGFRGDAALASLYLLGFGLMQIVGHRAAGAWGLERILEAVSWVVLTGALLSAALAAYQWLQLDFLGVLVGDTSRDSRIFANLNQPNQLATLLVLGLICTACLFDASRVGAATALALLVPLAFCLAMTESRVAVLEVVVAGALLAWKSNAFGRSLQRRHLLIGVALVLLMPLLWEAVNATLALSAGRDPAVTSLAGARRTTFWSAMVDASLRRPWAGFGWIQTTVAQFTVSADHPAIREVFGYGHNLLIDLLLWNGLPFGLLLCAGLALWFWASGRAVHGSAATLALACVVVVFVHALLEYPLYYAYFLLPVGLLMGALSATSMPRKSLALPAWTVLALGGAAVAMLAVVASDYFHLEQDVDRLRFEQARIGTDRPKHELSRPVLLTQLGAFTRFARTPEHQGMSDAELQAMAAVVARFPSPSNIVRYAAALALNDRPAQASEVLRRVCKMNSAIECGQMKDLWGRIGEREPAVARVAWPED